MIFASDNWSGASEKVVAAVAAAARTGGPAYGGDPLTRQVERRFSELFERDVAVFFVATGTAANALAVSAFARPGGFVLCHRAAHLIADEPGSTELFGGMRLVGLAGEAGRIEPAAFDAELDLGSQHRGDPVVLSVSQITESGTVYPAETIKALADRAHQRKIAVHMDGARFAGAMAGSVLSPADATWRLGVDVMSFGGTKNGCLAADAVVFFDPAQAANFPTIRQRAGHTFSKSWFVAAQFAAYLDGGHWLDLGRRANAAGARLADALKAAPGVRLAWQPGANEIFAILPTALDAKLRAAGVVYGAWPVDGLAPDKRPRGDEVLVRFVTSFATTDADIGKLAALVSG